MPRRSTSQYPALRALQLPAGSLLVPAERDDVLKAVGTKVRRGESLYASTVETGPVPRSPVDGVIVERTKCRVIPDREMPAVRIEAEEPTATTDANDAKSEPAAALVDPAGVTTDQLTTWIDRIHAAGISADRVSCPNLSGQLRQLLKRPCDTILCAALDNEPDVQLNAALSATYVAEIRAAMQLLKNATGARRALFVTSQFDRPKAALLRRQARWKKIGVRAVSVRNVYPQSDPTLLIHTLLKRRLRPGRLPTEIGVLLLDAQAAVAIGSMILAEQAMLEVPVVLCDVPGARVHHVTVPIGTSMRQLLDALAMQSEGVLLSAGDSLRRMQTSLDAVIAGGENVLHVGYAGAVANPDPCIRCGWCVDACPTRVHPAGVLEAAQYHDMARAEAFGLHACIECGICSYVCPSRLPLLQSIRLLRVRRTP